MGQNLDLIRSGFETVFIDGSDAFLNMGGSTPLSLALKDLKELEKNVSF